MGDKRKDGLQWCHIISRRFLVIRWEMRNCLCLCAACHRWGTDNPMDWTLWLIKSFGTVWYDWLMHAKRSKRKLFYDEIEKQIKKEKKGLIPTRDAVVLKEIVWD